MQGGYLLSSTKCGPMQNALAIALDRLRSYAPSWKQAR